MTTTYQNGATTHNGASSHAGELVRELYGGELYEYYPLGQYIVQAPGVCGGRPTFKYTRLEPSVILAQLSLGRTVEDLLRDYHGSKISAESIYEAIYLANQAFMLVHNARLNEPEALEWNFA
jgi:uncharacterized protein (DUF433 family)